jgi:hypothetical protein
MLKDLGIPPHIDKTLKEKEVFITDIAYPIAAQLVKRPIIPLEPIKPKTLEKFLEAHKKMGLKLDGVKLNYQAGLRETTFERSIYDGPPPARTWKYEPALDKYSLELVFVLAPYV